MTDHLLTDRDRRLLREIERLRRCDDPSVDSAEAQLSVLMAGLPNMEALVTTRSQDAYHDGKLLLEIEKLRRCDNPSVDSPDAQISLVLSGLTGIAERIRSQAERSAVARIVDDEIWDGDGDYPLDRRRIAERRAKAYAKADAIVSLMRGQ